MVAQNGVWPAKGEIWTGCPCRAGVPPSGFVPDAMAEGRGVAGGGMMARAEAGGFGLTRGERKAT